MIWTLLSIAFILLWMLLSLLQSSAGRESAWNEMQEKENRRD